MNIKIFGLHIHLSFYFLAMITIMLLFDRTGIVVISVVCSAVHELGHIIALVVLRKKPITIHIKVFGITLSRELLSLTFGQELFVVALGPAFNLIFALALLLFRRINLLFVFSIVTCCFNLLPIKPLDGGRILESVLTRFLSCDTVNKIMNVIAFFVLTAVFFAIILILLYNGGNMCLIFVFFYLLILFLTKKQ